ncbi:MAG: DNA-binding response regulator MtrA [Anaerolineales bacterium]|nr:DNA-binding response regulator MtrA [Anaerolineales bacterium]
MLAEDDATMLTLLTTLLKMEGFQTTALDADNDIVAEVAAQRPDILLMDVHLANKNGLDELKRLRAAPGGAQVRVVMASGLNVKDECLKNGADAFLMKPYAPEDLFAVLRGKNE